MSADFWNKMSTVAATSKPVGTKEQGHYAFTEIVTITCISPVDLADLSSAECRAWTQAMQDIHQHPGTSQLWWGYHVNNPRIIKLIVDWKAVDRHDASLVDQAMSPLTTSGENSAALTTGRSFEYYVFHAMSGYRQNAFRPPDNYFKNAVVVFVSFYFAPEWDPADLDKGDEARRSKKNVWDNHWSILRQAALKSEGAWVADKSLDGWSGAATSNAPAGPRDGKKSFVSIIRFENQEAATAFVRKVEDPEQRFADGALIELKRLAGRGMQVEVVSMKYQSS